MEEQSPSEPELGYQDYYDLGIRYLSEGNYEEAIIAFTASIEIEPKQAGAYVGRAEAYVKTGETVDNLEAARLDYEKILELDEAAAEAYLGLADVHIRRGEYEEALEILREGIERTGDIQPFQDKIFEIENSYGLSSEKENPLVALLHAGDDGNLLRADEVTIFGYNPENVSLSRAEQIFEQNGFDCERAGLALMGYKGLPSMPDLYVSVALDDSGDVIRNFNLSANSKEPSLINVGLRDICTMDSLETVLSKLGFTNAAELADLVTYTYSLPDEERRQFFKSGGNVNGLQYDNGNFSMHIFPEMDSTEEFFVDIVVRGLPGLWNYNMFFIFSNAMSLDTYRLSVVSWSPSY